MKEWSNTNLEDNCCIAEFQYQPMLYYIFGVQYKKMMRKTNSLQYYNREKTQIIIYWLTL